MDDDFRMLNLNRVQLDVLVNHSQAIRRYEKCGFQIEGRRRQAQLKAGECLDIVFMGVLRSERERSEELGELPPEAAICAAHGCFFIEDKRLGENSHGD